MEWWLWLAGGLALVVAELVTPSGFFIIFFGLGALTVGVLAALGVVTSAAAAVAAVQRAVRRLPRCCLPRPPASPRSRFRRRRTSIRWSACWRSSRSGCARRVGRVEVRGAMWSARNTSAVTLDAGQRARVAAVDGLTLRSFPNRLAQPAGLTADD